MVNFFWNKKKSGRKGSSFLTIKQNDEGYYYAERKGVDSVAFVLYDKNKYPAFGLIKEYKPPVSEFLTTAFGGSLDKNLVLPEIVKEEVHEEAGYIVSTDNVYYVGKRFVSSQMNQYCYLYAVDVTGLTPGKTNPQNEIEASATVVWVNKEEILDGVDWKSQAIIERLETGWKKVEELTNDSSNIEHFMKQAIKKLHSVKNELLTINDRLVTLDQAAIYFQNNSGYLKMLYNDKTEQEIVEIISKTINKKE